jgi:hypothetical protein
VLQAIAAGDDVVVTAVNDHSRYRPMVRDWCRFWRTIAQVNNRTTVPVVIAFDSVLSDFHPRDRGSIVLAEPPAGVPSALAAQMSRIIWPGTLPQGTGYVMTTDVDMLPLSMTLLDAARLRAADSFVIARNVLEADGQFPICYSVATTGLWREVFSSSNDFASDLSSAIGAGTAYSGTHGGTGWFTDQEYLFERVTEWERKGGSVVRLRDADSGHQRLDRTSSRTRTVLGAPLIARQRWTDYHSYEPSPATTAINSWIHFWLARQRNAQD